MDEHTRTIKQQASLFFLLENILSWPELGSREKHQDEIIDPPTFADPDGVCCMQVCYASFFTAARLLEAEFSSFTNVFKLPLGIPRDQMNPPLVGK